MLWVGTGRVDSEVATGLDVWPLGDIKEGGLLIPKASSYVCIVL